MEKISNATNSPQTATKMTSNPPVVHHNNSIDDTEIAEVTTPTKFGLSEVTQPILQATTTTNDATTLLLCPGSPPIEVVAIDMTSPRAINLTNEKMEEKWEQGYDSDNEISWCDAGSDGLQDYDEDWYNFVPGGERDYAWQDPTALTLEEESGNVDATIAENGTTNANMDIGEELPTNNKEKYAVGNAANGNNDDGNNKNTIVTLESGDVAATRIAENNTNAEMDVGEEPPTNNKEKEEENNKEKEDEKGNEADGKDDGDNNKIPDPPVHVDISDEKIEVMKVEELKTELRKRAQKTTGAKAVLNFF